MSTHHYTSTTQPERSTARPIAAVAALVLLIGVVILATSTTARASEVIYDCPAAQAGNGDPGPWTVLAGQQNSKVSCAGGPGDWIGPRGSSMSANSNDGVEVTVPKSSGLTLRKAEIWWRVPGQTEGSDNFALAYADGGVLGEAKAPLESLSSPSVFTLPSTTTSFELADYCSTDRSDQSCGFGAGQAPNLELYGAALTIEDSRLPTGKATGGGLTATGALSGTQSLSYSAEDPDTGVRLVKLLIDGQPVASNDYTSQCSYTNFQACPGSVSETIAWNTALITDGQHSAQLVVEDAAQNTSTIYTTTVTTHNAPTSTTPPTISPTSQPQPGTTLTAHPGSWSTPAGAGETTDAYQWQQCDTQGNNCQAIPGAEAATYTTQASDAGHTLRVLVTATNNDGAATATSPATSTVESPPPATPGGLGPSSTQGQGAPNGTPASTSAVLHLNGHKTIHEPYARRAFKLGGTLTDSHGHPIADASLDILQTIATSTTPALIERVTTTTTGAFTATIPAGPSRRVEVAYRAFANDGYAATATMTENVAAGIQLHANTYHTSSTSTIKFTGQVSGPTPHIGAIVIIRVYYHNSWVTIRTPRTESHGTFHAHYTFQGSLGRWQFYAEVPAGQANYPYTAGQSRTLAITTQ